MTATATIDEQDVMRRAFAAWFRSSQFPNIPVQPSNSSQVEEVGGKYYAVLRNVNGTLAVYRVRNDGSLKSLRRWPKEFEEA